MVAIPVHENFSTTSPHPPASADVTLLRREAAHLGPGLFGTRRDGTDAERLALARRFADLGEPAPVYVLARAEWTDRRARLFVAGEYADKGLTVTADHLAALATGFDAPVPVLVEHADSPLGLGYVTSVEHDGDALYGTVTLSAEADALLRACGATSLSVGLAPDLSRLVEVSVVRNPRVADARLFTAGPRFDATLESGIGVPPMCPPDVASENEPTRGTGFQPVVGGASCSADDHRTIDLHRPADPDIDRLLSEGRLLPCQLDAARKLLERGQIHFGETDARGEIRHLLIELLEARPPSVLFSEVAPATPNPRETEDAAAALLLPEEAAFYRRHFPDLALAEILQRRR